VQSNKVSTTFPNDLQVIVNYKKDIRTTPDDDFVVALATLNPVVTLLCLDQGMDSNAHYTPMAMPRSNGRSVVSDHVDTVCRSYIDKRYGIVSKQKFALSPYFVVKTHSKVENGDNNSPFGYKCILNRDRHSHRGDIEGKKADVLSVERLITLYDEVSDSNRFVRPICATSRQSNRTINSIPN
jgi:hypothetical protein